MDYTGIIDMLKQKAETFLDQVSKKYSLDRSELSEMWYGVKVNTPTKTESTKTTPVKRGRSSKASDEEPNTDMEDLSVERLSKCTIPDLKTLCRHHSLLLTGNKADLYNRLIDFSHNKSEGKLADFKPKPKVKKSVDVVPEVLKPTVSVLSLRKNKYDNYEDAETKFVFDKATSKVVGKQNYETGNIDELSPLDIETCKCRKYDYVLPDNLNKKLVKPTKENSDTASLVVEETESSSESSEGDDEEESEDESDDEDV